MPIKDVTFDGISFKNVTTSNFRTCLVRYAVNVTFSNCNFEAGGLPGRQVGTADTLGVNLINCTTFRNPAADASGSSWNSFYLGGGTQDIKVTGCTFRGESQTVDIAPGTLTSDIGSTSSQIRAEYLTAQIFSITNSSFFDCANGMTTHPATYGLTVTGCNFEGCSTGLLVRSLKNTIVGNVFHTRSSGVSLSSFFEDTLISSNNFDKMSLSTPTSWVGVSMTGMSSETMNNNAFKNVIVQGNTFRTSQAHSGNVGIQFRHNANGVPPNVAFTKFTDSIKTGLTNVVIKDNNFVRCSVLVRRWFNDIKITGNTFSGGSDLSYYVQCDADSARHLIHSNTFLDDTAQSIFVSTATNPTYGYNTAHRIGYNYGRGLLTGTFDNCSFLYMTGAGFPMVDGIQTPNGGTIQSVRGSGTSTLHINAHATDNVSDVSVSVFQNNTTTGTKTVDVYGNLSSENSYPRATATYTSGIASRVWSGGFTQTAFTVTSDDREKIYLPIEDAERDVALELKSAVKKFKFITAITEKGESNARIHFGTSAQTVKSIFEKHGLNAFDYAVLCHDEWDDVLDEEGNVITEAGDRYGIRYEELLMFMMVNS
jgi:hypothetical protein